MILRKVVVSPKVKYKIKSKHNVDYEEIEIILKNNPLIYKTKDKKYVAIGKYLRYLTIIFNYKGGYANIITAYPSSDWQIKLYKNKKGG